MAESDTTEGESLVKCEVCLKEIPKSEAKSTEVQDYVMHFCGLNCYEKWSKQKETESDK